MPDEKLEVDVQDVNETKTPPPAFTIFCSADYTEEEDEMDFRFQATTPERPNVMDWISFLFLSRHKVDTLYTLGLEKAIVAYLEIREDVGEEVAKADIESYLAARIAQDYEEGNPLGLREICDESD